MSTTINSAQYTQLLTQLSSQFGMSNTSASSYLNSIWGISADVDGLVNGENLSSSQKESIIQDLIQRGFSLFMGFFNAAGKAKQETKTSDTQVKTTLDNYLTEREATTKKIDKILDEIENKDMKAIADALDAIDSLESSEYAKLKEQIEAKQQEMIECANAIKQAQNEGNVEAINENYDKLNIIRGEIKGLISTVQTSIEAKVAEQTSVVAEHTAHITELQVEAEQELAEQIKKATKKMGEEAKEGAINVKYIAKGGVETAEGEAIIAAGTGASVVTFGASAALAGKKGEDLIAAGTEHISGGGQNLAKVREALAKMGDGMADVSRYATTIGSVLSNSVRLIGDYSAKASGLITNVTAYGSLVSAGIGDEGALTSAINADLQAIQTAIEESAPDSNTGSNNKTFDFTTTGYSSDSPVSNPSNAVVDADNSNREQNKELLKNIELNTTVELIGGLFKSA